MTFHDPWILLLAPVACIFLYIAGRKAQRPALLFPSGAFAAGLPVTFRVRLAGSLPLLRGVAVLLAVVALARPQAVWEEKKVATEGIDIVLALDVSSSMLVEDFADTGNRQNRLAAAKQVIREFIGARPSDRIGMVVFAGRAYVLSPLTLNHDWLLQNLDRVEVDLIEDGTAIGSGLMASLDRLRTAADRRKVIILLTDGRNNAGEIAPPTAAEAARALQAKVYTVGIGSGGKAAFPVTDPFGGTVYRTVDARVDEATLRQIATATGASFFRAASDLGALREIYRQIDRLEKGRIEETVHRHQRELYHWFLAPAAALLLLELLLAATVARRHP